MSNDGAVRIGLQLKLEQEKLVAYVEQWFTEHQGRVRESLEVQLKQIDVGEALAVALREALQREVHSVAFKVANEAGEVMRVKLENEARKHIEAWFKRSES